MKGFVTVIVFCAFLHSSQAAPNLHLGRIIGGHDAAILDYPYQVSIQYHENGHFCGGTVYTPKTIITAAHCVSGVPPSEVFVRAGSNLRSEGGFVSNVEKIIVSELWNERTVNADIAVLILKESLPISDTIRTIKLSHDEPRVGDIARISGWGLQQNNFASGEDDDIPEKLQAVEIPIFDWAECNRLYDGAITDNMFCAGLKAGGKDSCRMDSGGPLVVKNVLSGVVSWGKECGAPNSPGIYTKVKNFITWIDSVAE